MRASRAKLPPRPKPRPTPQKVRQDLHAEDTLTVGAYRVVICRTGFDMHGRQSFLGVGTRLGLVHVVYGVLVQLSRLRYGWEVEVLDGYPCMRWIPDPEEERQAS